MFNRKKPGRASGRVVFRYFDGREDVHADPLLILRKLEEHGGPNWKETVQTAGRTEAAFDIEPPDVAKERQKRKDALLADVADMTRKAFGLSPMDKSGEGLTEAEQIGVLSQYLEYVGGLAKEAAPFSNSPPAGSR